MIFKKHRRLSHKDVSSHQAEKMTGRLDYDDWETARDAWQAMENLLNARSYSETLDAMKRITPELRDRLLVLVNKLRAPDVAAPRIVTWCNCSPKDQPAASPRAAEPPEPEQRGPEAAPNHHGT